MSAGPDPALNQLGSRPGRLLVCKASGHVEVMAEEGLGARLTRVGMPDAHALLGAPTPLYRHGGLDGEGVAAKVLQGRKARG